MIYFIHIKVYICVLFGGVRVGRDVWTRFLGGLNFQYRRIKGREEKTALVWVELSSNGGFRYTIRIVWEEIFGTRG